jgi:hypothetical protein
MEALALFSLGTPGQLGPKLMDFNTKPEVVRCYFETSVQPHVPAMDLRWDPDAPGVAERTWHLPDGVCLKGPAPVRFGVTIHRRGPNAYRVRVLWDQLCLDWKQLTRVQVMSSALAPLLRSLGTDMWYLLDQPVDQETAHPAKVA